MYKQPQIYYLTHDKLKEDGIFDLMVQDKQNSYYWSDDWSCEFYIELAKKGFISTTYDTKDGLIILPELEFDYGILDFENLHISKKVKKLLKERNYQFCIDENLDEVLDGIATLHKDNWLKGNYVELVKKLHKLERDDFRLHSIELMCDGKVVSGEIGYETDNGVYTSLSGFSLKSKEYNNYGTLQLVLLAKHLQKRGFRFWNLGHPHMPYKLKLGAKVYKREEFLKRWSFYEV